MLECGTCHHLYDALFCPTSQLHDMLPLPMLLLLQGHTPDLGCGHYKSRKQGAVLKRNLNLEVTDQDKSLVISPREKEITKAYD